MLLAILAGICMMFQDTLSVIKFQAASRNHGLIAAVVDIFLWGLTMAGTTITVFALHSGNRHETVLIIIFVAIGTVIGNISGTKVGKKFVKDTENLSQDAQIKALKDRVDELEINRGNS